MTSVTENCLPDEDSDFFEDFQTASNLVALLCECQDELCNNLCSNNEQKKVELTQTDLMSKLLLKLVDFLKYNCVTPTQHR